MLMPAPGRAQMLLVSSCRQHSSVAPLARPSACPCLGAAVAACRQAQLSSPEACAPCLMVALLLLLLMLLMLLLLQKARHLLDTMDSALAPLQTQLDAVVNINAPDLLSYAGWMANQAALKQRMDGEQLPGLARWHSIWRTRPCRLWMSVSVCGATAAVVCVGVW